MIKVGQLPSRQRVRKALLLVSLMVSTVRVASKVISSRPSAVPSAVLDGGSFLVRPPPPQATQVEPR